MVLSRTNLKIIGSALSQSALSTLLFVGEVVDDENVAENVGMDETGVVELLPEAFAKHLPAEGFFNRMP